jgi:Ca2+/Na+ antiporter
MALDTLLFNACSFVAGLFLLEWGADSFVDHSVVVAKRLGISPTLVSLLTAGGEWEEVRPPLYLYLN